MKTCFSILVILFLLAENAATAQFTKASLQASGLTCAICTKAIHTALGQISFVESVKPDIKNSSYLLIFKKNSMVDADVLKKAVEDAGFFVSKLKLTGTFNDIAVKNDEHIVYDGKTYHFLNIKEQALNGEQTITLVDKNYLPAKEFKKISTYTEMACVQTGRAGSCCAKNGVEEGSRIYHVTL